MNTCRQQGFGKIGAEVLKSTFGILLSTCAKFKLTFFKCSNFAKPLYVIDNQVAASHI